MHGLLRSLLQEQQHQQHDVHNINSNDDNTMSTNAPTNGTVAPIVVVGAVNLTDSYIEAELAEEVHVFDANASLALNATLIVCLLLAYYVKKFKIYYLTESAGALIVGMIIGGIARLTTDNLQLFEFSPEVFFFVLLPPIIFEAGYAIDRRGFFDNIGAISLYTCFGTIISTFVIGILCYITARVGLVQGIDSTLVNPMESLMFGALISAVDPVATLSIMGNPELNCDPLLYSLVFGESVLNDAIAISLFKTFFKYYNPDGPDWSESEVPSALLNFLSVSLLSILVGVTLGLVCSWIYKHTSLHDHPNLECSLLFCFCYLCYSTAEAVQLSGIMAIFFQGVVLSHYNSYNLSSTAHVASEQIFSTFATITETIVFLYMGMGVFTGRFQNWDISFSVLAMAFCLVGRFLNIFPLSWLANRCRSGQNKIPVQMQAVLWLAGLRGAIAFALSENMPGPHKEVYATATLSICIFTTVVCGGFTEQLLTAFGMKNEPHPLATRTQSEDSSGEHRHLTRLTYTPPVAQQRRSVVAEMARRRVHEGVKSILKRFDDKFLKPNFGGSNDVENLDHHATAASIMRNAGDSLGNYELGAILNGSDSDDDE